MTRAILIPFRFPRYQKLSKSDDSCEHSLEIGYVSLINLLPNQIYKQVIVPTELNRNMPVDRQVSSIIMF